MSERENGYGAASGAGQDGGARGTKSKMRATTARDSRPGGAVTMRRNTAEDDALFDRLLSELAARQLRFTVREAAGKLRASAVEEAEEMDSPHSQAERPFPGQKLRSEIEQRAYELFLARGAADGHAVEDWLEAERQVLAEKNKR